MGERAEEGVESVCSNDAGYVTELMTETMEKNGRLTRRTAKVPGQGPIPQPHEIDILNGLDVYIGAGKPRRKL